MSTPTAQIQQWLSDFGGAVSRGDFGMAASMFGDDSYWRDLVSFTWNLKTAEGPQQIQAMLEATMPNAKPSNFAIQGEGSEANGVTESWFTFETATGRGRGHLRLIGGKAWTLLTTLQELKGFEEKKARAAHQGRRARRAARIARPGSRRARKKSAAGLHEATLRGDHRRRAGRHHAWRAAEEARRAGDHHRKECAAGRHLAQPLQEPVPARPGVVRPPAVPAVPRRLAGVQPEGQDRRLARELHQADGAQLLGSTECKGARWDEPSSSGTSTCSTRARRSRCSPSTWCSHRHVAVPNMPSYPGAEQLQGHAAALQPVQERRGLARQEGVVRRLEQLGARHLCRPVGARRRRDDGPALHRRTWRASIR